MRARRVLLTTFVAVVLAGGPSGEAAFAQASHAGTCGGDFGTSCSHTELADAVAGRLALDLRIFSTQGGVVPADGFSEGLATLALDVAGPAGAETFDVTVVVDVAKAEVLRRNGILAPPVWTDDTPSYVGLLLRASAEGCACDTVERLLVAEGSALVPGTVETVLRVRGAPGARIEISLLGLARLGHDFDGSPTLPDKGSVRTQAEAIVRSVTVTPAEA